MESAQGETAPVPGLLVILSAPSGAGKTSLYRGVLERMDNVVASVSHTTRPPRPGEQDGVDYHFVSEPVFEELVECGEFLEHAWVFDRYYGTSHSAVDRHRAAGRDVILEIDWQGARQIREQLSDAVSVFVLPPSRQALEERLEGRGQDDSAVIARRMRDAESEMSHYDEYDFVLVNDDFEDALDNLMAIIRSERVRLAHRREAMDGFVAGLMGRA